MPEGPLILAINPGSTTTKIAVYREAPRLFQATIEYLRRGPGELPDGLVAIRDAPGRPCSSALEKAGIDIRRFDAIATRGAPLPPLKAAPTASTPAMVDRLINRPVYEHASNVGPVIGFELGGKLGIPAYIYDCDHAWTNSATRPGSPACRPSRAAAIAHVLNMRAQARKGGEKIGKPYERANIIVTHLGGGITSSIHRSGRMVDVVSDDEGPFSPERAGGVPCAPLLDLCYSGRYPFQTMRRMLRGQGGLIGYPAPVPPIEVEQQDRRRRRATPNWSSAPWPTRSPRASASWRPSWPATSTPSC